MNLTIKRIAFFESVLSLVIILVYFVSSAQINHWEYFISCHLVVHGVLLLTVMIIWLGELLEIF